MPSAVLQREAVAAAINAFVRRADGLGSVAEAREALRRFLQHSGCADVFMKMRGAQNSRTAVAFGEICELTGPPARRVAYDIACAAGIAASKRFVAGDTSPALE